MNHFAHEKTETVYGHPEVKEIQGHQLIMALFFSYSVTQSYKDILLGDVVFDTFNIVSRDEDNILDQIYIKQICRDFYYDDF